MPDESSTIVSESQLTIPTLKFLALQPQLTQFKPRTRHTMAHLHPPEPTRAFRFSYPILGVAALNSVYLWNVRTGAFVQTIEGTQLSNWNGGGDGLATVRFLGITSRLGRGMLSCMGSIRCGCFPKIRGSACWMCRRRRRLMDDGCSVYSWRSGRSVHKGSVAMRRGVVAGSQPRGQEDLADEFIAVHISSCGRHLAALLYSSRLVIVCDFELAAQERCGRGSRLTCRLPHSGSILMGSLRWSHILRLPYTFSSLNFSRIIKLLTTFFFNFELQIDVYNVSEDLQIHSTLRSPKFSTHHAPSRISSKIPLLSRRIGHWFRFYFPSYEYFCLFDMLLLKIQDLDTFPLPRLVNIQVNGPIVQMSRVEDSPSGVLRACCGSERRQSIEHPDEWITPRAIPVH